MRIHTYGEGNDLVMIMLPSSFCNADTTVNILSKREAEFRVPAVEYNGQYPGGEKPFTSDSSDKLDIQSKTEKV